MKTIALAGLLAASTSLAANAATIEYKVIERLNVITVVGRIDRGDEYRFGSVASTIDGTALVILNSPGGVVVDGLDIGLMIHRNGYFTAVPEDTVCASVCGLIWLAGSKRGVAPSSKIGFHAAYGPNGEETGSGNALVGGYLKELGFSYGAIAYLTSAPPDDMQWLTPEIATKFGITYSLLSPPKSEPKPFIAQPAPQYQAPSLQPAPGSLPVEQQAAQLVQSYFAYWSQSGTNVEGLAQYYSPSIQFFGSPTRIDKVMDAKRKYAIRWPIRHYAINPGSVFVQCDSEGCTVTGVVNWDCSSLARSEHSVGSANYAFRIANGVIVSENGSVLTGHKDTVESQQQAGQTASYAQGRQARIEYEQWYSKLPEGIYKDGASFWAAHRSDKPQPNCVGTPGYVAGCTAARVKLTASDMRRIADKDFWYGWNSL